MKVCIITEGGKGIGFGHIARCWSLFEAFASRGMAPVFIINADRDTVEAPLRGVPHTILNWLEKSQEALDAVAGADIAVIDSYLADRLFYEKISRAVRIAVYIDDMARIDYPRGAVVNGAIYAGKLGYPRRAGLHYILGPRYILLRKEFQGAYKRVIKDKIGSALITFGCNDSAGMIEKVAAFLEERYPQFEKNIVIGPGFENANNTGGLRRLKARLLRDPSADKMREAMLASDIAVSAGGQTLHELARLGTPAIGVCVAENQKLNLEGWEEAGFLRFAGWCDEPDLLGRIDGHLAALADEGARRASSASGMARVDGNGAKRVVDTVMTLAERA